jgi:hypothetical protein
MLQEGGIMEKQLAECLAENRIYTLYEGGITMLRKLFNGRRKFVTLVVLAVALGAVGVWIWAQVGAKAVPLRVAALDAEISSIKVPVNGEWKETGPIKVSLAEPTTQLFPSGKLYPARQSSVVVWPVSISAPLLEELGLGKIETFLVGVGKRADPNTDSMIAVDFTVLRIPGLPEIVLTNGCCIICFARSTPAGEQFWQGTPGAELRGDFKLREDLFSKVDMRELAKESFTIADGFMHFPVEDVDTFLNTVIDLIQRDMHEIVVYIPAFNSYQTADLKGTSTLRVGGQ